MPFSSRRQERYLFSQHPDVARKFVADAKAAHEPVVADGDLESKIAARMGTRPQSPEDYRRAVAKHYADGEMGTPPPGSLAAALRAGPLQDPLATPQVPASPFELGISPTADPDAFAAQTQRRAAVLSQLSQQRAVDNAESLRQSALNSGPAANLSPEDREALLAQSRAAAAPKAAPAPALTDAPKPAAAAGPGSQAGFAIGGGGGAGKPPQWLKDYQDSQRAELGAAERLGKANAQEATDVGTAAAVRADERGRQAEDIRERAAEHDADLQRREQQLNDLSREVADKKIEPFPMTTGNRIRFALMGALGGFMQGYRGTGQNLGLERMNKEMDDYFAKQREEIERKKGRIGDMQGLLASAYRRYGNMDQAEAAARVVALQQIDDQQQEHAAGTKSQAALAASDQFTAHLKGQQALEMAKLTKPAGPAGPTLAQVQVRARALYDKAVEGNRPITWEDAKAEAMHQYGMPVQGLSADAFSKVPGGGKPAVDPFAGLDTPQSTSAGLQGIPDPRAYFGGTETGGQARANETWNTALKGIAHKNMGARTPENQEHVMAPYLIQKGDSPEVVADKVDRARRAFGGANAGAGAAPPDTTEDFEPDKD